MTIRPATRRDDAALAALDRVTWSWQTSPASPPPPGTPFFHGRADPADVLVADDGELVGYVQIGPSIPARGSAAASSTRLRVLAPNAAARAVYAETGFVVEGVLRGEFLLDGRYVDDLLMARDLTSDDETQGVP